MSVLLHPFCTFFLLFFAAFLKLSHIFSSMLSLPSSRWTPDIFKFQRKVDFNGTHCEFKCFNTSFLCLSPLTVPVSPPIPLFMPLVQYQMEMMRSLRHVNIDHLHVGWYQSTYYGSFVSRALLDSQFSYQHAIEESVVLIYGE